MTRTALRLVGLTMGLVLAPALARTAPPAVSFDNQVQAYARVWSAPPAECDSPLRQNSPTSEAEAATFKADIRTYQVCLKAALGTIQARQSPEPLVGAARWATLSDSQKATLQDALEIANRKVIDGIVAKGSEVAQGARDALSVWQAQVAQQKQVLAEARNAQEVSEQVSKINSCGPRYSRLRSRGDALDEDAATLKSEETGLAMMSLNITSAAALGDEGRYYSLVSEFSNREYRHNQKVQNFNERAHTLKSDGEDFNDDCGRLAVSGKALDQACEDSNNQAFCRLYNH